MQLVKSAPLLTKRNAQMSYNQLAERERHPIDRLKKAEHSKAEIAKLISRHPATIGP